MSDTPRTDEVWADKSRNILEHARKLERELNEATKNIHQHQLCDESILKAEKDRDAWKQCAEELAEQLRFYCDVEHINDGIPDYDANLTAIARFNQLKEQTK